MVLNLIMKTFLWSNSTTCDPEQNQILCNKSQSHLGVLDLLFIEATEVLIKQAKTSEVDFIVESIIMNEESIST